MANSRLMLRGCQLCACIAVMLFCLANSKQQTANSKQQTANSKQQTANSRPHAAAVHQRIHYAMQLRITSPHQIPQIEAW
ncbi:hypothetical protein VDR12_05160 [Xanthomonas campestris pv. campestris]|nr:hypothetical protein [Xanthomonas campestris pv. campestris]